MSNRPRHIANLNAIETLTRSVRNRAEELRKVSKNAPVGKKTDWTPIYKAHVLLLEAVWDLENYLYPPQNK